MFRIGVARVPPWGQAWGWGSQVNAWGPGLCSRDPAGLHSLGYGAQLLEKGWTVLYSAWTASVDYSPPPQLLSVDVLPCECELVSLRLWVEDWSLTVVLANWPNGSANYPAF